MQIKVSELRGSIEVEQAERVPSVSTQFPIQRFSYELTVLSFAPMVDVPLSIEYYFPPAPQAERTAALGHLSELQVEVANLQAELNAYGQCNPEQAEIKRQAIALAKEAALRWTGEYWAVPY